MVVWSKTLKFSPPSFQPGISGLFRAPKKLSEIFPETDIYLLTHRKAADILPADADDKQHLTGDETMTKTQGNYKATVTQVVDGYGDSVFRVKVLCLTGTHVDGDVCFLKDYENEDTANRAAVRELKKAA